jgi:hypothetical protein
MVALILLLSIFVVRWVEQICCMEVEALAVRSFDIVLECES